MKLKLISLLIGIVLVGQVEASRMKNVIQPGSEAEERLLRAIEQATVHKDILTTVFWVGERAKPNSGWSDNLDSAWDRRWKENFGGLDSPVFRKGFFPAAFQPKQNPFYAALPFNDVSNPDYLQTCPLLQYFKLTKTPTSNSVCKNKWIEISLNGKYCYAQWQDVGPIYTNDYDYVFGEEAPRANNVDKAGLDVSPAVRDFLSFKGLCKSSWRFVNEADVPMGPWKAVVTRS
jgi:hypothetical protein